jgi:peptide/nickel transport system permease protein
LVTFAVIHLVPGDPSTAMLSPEQAGPGGRAAAKAFREAMGLDQPLPVRYARWLGRVASLDFGLSSYDQRPVGDKLKEALPTTVLLSSLALLLAFALAIPLGVTGAARKGTAVDRSLSAGLIGLYSLPSFWVAILLVMLLTGGRYLSWFPMQGLASPGAEHFGPLRRLADLGWHLVLPVFCLGYAQLALVARYLRSGMLEALRQDYVLLARAKGLSEGAVLYKHALRNALVPLVTLLGLSVPTLVGGSVIVEQVFGLPGMGRLGFQAIATRDYNTVMAVTTLAALLTMAGVLLSDVLYSVVDPRIRRS